MSWWPSRSSKTVKVSEEEESKKEIREEEEPDSCNVSVLFIFVSQKMRRSRRRLFGS